MATSRPSRPSNPIIRWVKEKLWYEADGYFNLPETYAKQPDPPYDDLWGKGTRDLLQKLYDWTGGSHPTAWFYVGVGIVLAVITYLEFWAFSWPFSKIWINSVLFALSAVKFIMVVAFFMHLKFDSPLFRRVFGFGFVLAIAISLSVLALFFKLNG